jgi:hypothetical protein
LAEQLFCNQRVVGSSPTGSSKQTIMNVSRNLKKSTVLQVVSVIDAEVAIGLKELKEHKDLKHFQPQDIQEAVSKALHFKLVQPHYRNEQIVAVSLTSDGLNWLKDVRIVNKSR